MSPAKALRRALSRSADTLWGLMMTSQGVSQETLNQDDVCDLLTKCELLVLLDGQDGRAGALTMDRNVLTGLTEAQTLGRVTGKAIEDRPLTATDAALVAPLIDDALGRFSTNLDGHHLCSAFSGFRYGAKIEDARSLSLLLGESEYVCFRVSLDLADGVRQGELVLILPLGAAKEPIAEAPEVAGQPGAHHGRLQQVRAEMRVDLCRIERRLSDLSALNPGDLIPLPDGVLNGARLVAPGGYVVAEVNLGRVDGFRAVRLETQLQSAPPQEQHAKVQQISMNETLSDAFVSVDEDLARTPEPETEEILPDLPPLDFEENLHFAEDDTAA